VKDYCDRCDWTLSLSLASGGRQQVRDLYRCRIETIFIVKNYFSSVSIALIRNT